MFSDSISNSPVLFGILSNQRSQDNTGQIELQDIPRRRKSILARPNWRETNLPTIEELYEFLVVAW